MLLEPGDRELFRRIWGLAWPTVLYSLLESTLGLVDLAMVRSFGHQATAAVGVSRQVMFLVETLAVAVSTGVITLISQGVGAQRRTEVDDLVRQSAYLVLLLGAPAAVVGFIFSRPLLMMLNADAGTLVHAEPYLKWYFAGSVFAWAGFVGAAVFRGAGDATTPLKLAVAVNLLNVLFNWIFIYGPGPLPAFDVPGAAMGTVAARACGAAALVFLLVRGTGQVRLRWPEKGTARWGPNWEQIRRLLRVGLPMAAAGVLRNGSRLVFLSIVGATVLGVSFQTAVGVGLLVRMVGILPALAFQVALAVLVGQAIGRGDYADAESLGRRAVVLLAAIMAAVSGGVIVLAGPLAAVFIASPEVASLGAHVLRWFAVAEFFSALSITAQGALMGAGDTMPTMRYTLLTQWAVMLPLAYVTTTVLEWVPNGALVAWTLAPALSLLLVVRRFRGGRWKTLKL